MHRHSMHSYRGNVKERKYSKGWELQRSLLALFLFTIAEIIQTQYSDPFARPSLSSDLQSVTLWTLAQTTASWVHFSILIPLLLLYSTKLWSYRGGEMTGRLGLGGRHEGQVLDHLLGVLGLTGARLSSAEDALILSICNKGVSLASSYNKHWQ